MQSVQPAAPVTAAPLHSTRNNAAAEHIRGSSLLLVGRFIAYGLEFAAQVLLVRYLSKSDFGALSYALSIIILLEGIVVLELPNTLARFIPLYRERKAYSMLMGSIALGLATVAGLGALLAAGLYAAVGPLELQLTGDPRALTLLIALALLIPLEGLATLLTALFATLSRATEIAFRQVLTPALKLGVVLALMLLQADVAFVATGYVVAAAVTLLAYAWMLLRSFGKQPWLAEWRPRRLVFPAREVFGFALPLLASTLVWMLMESSDALLLGYFRNVDAVASFRAVLPIPRVLSTLTLTFAVLYTPLAARLYARGEHGELAELYRRVALWMTVLAFPVFAMAFSFARATTTGIYGERYADSAPIMALLSVGYYFFAVTGFNGLTLKIYKQLRYSVSVDIAAAILNVAVNLVLIPRYGTLGAAIGTSGTLLVHNALKQYGLWRYLHVNLFQLPYTKIYAALFVVALALLGLQSVLPASLLIAIPLSAAGSLLVLWIARDALEIDATFPELRRWPVVGAFLRWWLR
jgi:O-antigen/teichoic acid export membrane protein